MAENVRKNRDLLQITFKETICIAKVYNQIRVSIIKKLFFVIETPTKNIQKYLKLFLYPNQELPPPYAPHKCSPQNLRKYFVLNIKFM